MPSSIIQKNYNRALTIMYVQQVHLVQQLFDIGAARGSLESGIINPIFGAIYAGLFFLPAGPTRFAALRCMSVVLCQSCVSIIPPSHLNVMYSRAFCGQGIIPTLIIVRVGLGWSIVPDSPELRSSNFHTSSNFTTNNTTIHNYKHRSNLSSTGMSTFKSAATPWESMDSGGGMKIHKEVETSRRW